MGERETPRDFRRRSHKYNLDLVDAKISFGPWTRSFSCTNLHIQTPVTPLAIISRRPLSSTPSTTCPPRSLTRPPACEHPLSYRRPERTKVPQFHGPRPELAPNLTKQMATKKQIEANRRNAQKSTGPRTEEGKANCKMNALRHGRRAATVVLPYESQEDFDVLFSALTSEWNPQTETERILLDQMLVSQWKLQRNETIEHSIITVGKTHNMKPDLDQIWRQTSRLERSFSRAMQELTRLQKARKQEARTESATRVSPQPVANKPRMAPIVPISQP